MLSRPARGQSPWRPPMKAGAATVRTGSTEPGGTHVEHPEPRAFLVRDEPAQRGGKKRAAQGFRAGGVSAHGSGLAKGKWPRRGSGAMRDGDGASDWMQAQPVSTTQGAAAELPRPVGDAGSERGEARLNSPIRAPLQSNRDRQGRAGIRPALRRCLRACRWKPMSRCARSCRYSCRTIQRARRPRPG